MAGVTNGPLLVARDPVLVEAVLAAAAAAGVQPHVVREAHEVRAGWRSAPQVLVGVEMAALVCGISLEPRAGVHLLGSDLAELGQWSSPLQASVLVLPQQSALLGSLLEQSAGSPGTARVVRVVGGSGGLGTSTLCCALAQQAAHRGLASAVVELEATGGGLDLLFGAEGAAGWRWSDLRSAAGHIGTLAGQLPNVSGVDVVAHGRPELGEVGAPEPTRRRARAEDAALVGGGAPLPSPEAVRAVLSSLSRTHDLVVLDAGQGVEALADTWPGQRQLLLCGADVRQLMAARSRVRNLGLHDVEVVVRTGAARRLEPELVGEALQLPVVGTIRDERRVLRAAEAGMPPGRGRGGYARQVGRLLDELVAA